MDVNVQSWATAISTHAKNGRKIIWRFAEELDPLFDSELLPDRVIIVWRYKSETGQPRTVEHQQMNLMEDLLEPITEAGRFATLSLVSTGENLREWTYYARNGDDFVNRLNLGLAGHPVFPIEIRTASDPTWSTYKTFKAGVKTGTSEHCSQIGSI